MRFKKIILFFLGGLVFLPFSIMAQSEIKSDHYRITWPNTNSGAGLPVSDNYRMGVTTGQTAPGLYASSGYKIRAGFQYIHSIIPFSFAISEMLVNFGTLTPQTPATKQATLTVSVGGAGGYSIRASENTPLTATNGAVIPDTTCDNGNGNEQQAQVWVQNTTYGFGFNMSGTDIPSDFINNNYFRQFANLSNGEEPQIIMQGLNVGRNKQATITYKVNISHIQSAGNYQTILNFTAIPIY